MAQGKVKTVTDKGFGFISSDEFPKDVFYHERGLQGDLAMRKLRVGDMVSFDVEETEKGLSAVNIELIEE
jgi:cold shock protein